MAEIPMGNKIQRLCIFLGAGRGGGGEEGGKQGAFLEMCKWRIVFIAKAQIQV